MQRILFTAVLVLASSPFWAQGALITNDLPKIVPPSPTVAAFMKFEEVPVNNYTGIPDISIPLFSTKTHSDDINLNLSLNYHPSGIKVEEQASYVGLGWSFFGGGTISRTVRGLPDEQYYTDPGGALHYGIHRTQNPYYLFEDSFGSNTTQEQRDIIAEFLWETHEKGKYDSEHDLYQFNFMGHTGRFYISRETGAFKVIPLDDSNAVKVNYNIILSADLNAAALAATFTLYDEKGYRFEFDVKELTDQASDTGITTFMGASLGSGMGWAGHSNSPRFVSSFHLSKVYDPNNQLLIQYYYNDIVMPEYSRTVTTTYNLQPPGSQSAQQVDQNCPGLASTMEPREIRAVSYSNILTKKLTKIDVKDIAVIDFSMSKGRLDTDNKEAYKLDGIIVKNNKNEIIKNISFKYDHAELKFSSLTTKKRLSLSSVNEAYGADTLSYKLFYLDKSYNLGSISTDYWGYVTGPSKYKYANKRATNPDFSKVGVLQKMILPTGGAVVYSFESNRYSYIGNEPITDFSENPDNWNCYTTFEVFNPGLQQQDPFNPVNPTDPFDPNTPPGGPGTGMPVEEDPVILTDVVCERKDKDYKFLYGGGLRISKIGYFEEGNVNQNYYEATLESYEHPAPPVREKKYTYDFFNDSGRSSGSLVFPKPVYETLLNRKVFFMCSATAGNPDYPTVRDFQYKSSTSFNNLKALNTQGADVGYKNVQVEETHNGYSRYTYTSPIDKPEVGYSLTFPFSPSPNFDYKRGLLQNDSHYDLGNKILKNTDYQYFDNLSEHMPVTGYQIFSASKCPIFYVQNFLFAEYYTQSKNCIDNNHSGSYLTKEQVFCQNCLLPASYISYYALREAYGWRPLKEKNSKDYFYDGNSLQGTVSNRETFTYNPINKMIETHTQYTYNSFLNVEKLQKEYTYYNNVWANNIGNIEQIVTKKDDQIISTQKIIYDPSNFKPAIIQSSKGEVLPEDKIQFGEYDEFGNVLQVQRENGRFITYIYGYNKTLPIAMIEGMDYAAVIAACSGEVTAAVGASDSPTGTQDNLISKLKDIRDALPEAMVTTYTYKPLVGVTSVTDPKGQTTTYFYDVQGRLKEVRDRNNKLLSENKYNYRPQYDY